MNDEKGKVKYTLVIEYDPKDDRCEYIQERIIMDSDDEPLEIGEIDLEDYFSESDLACLTSNIIGKA
jgi:hypothetical protein